MDSNIIYLYSVGALDNNEIEIIIENLNNNDNLLVELGELQNIAAMFPVLLDRKNPPPELKEKILKSINKIREKERLKKTENIVKEIPPLKTPPPQSIIPEDKDDDNKIAGLEKKAADKFTREKGTIKHEKIESEDQKESGLINNKKSKENINKNRKVKWMPILLPILIVGLAAAYFIISSSIKNYETEINLLSQRVNNLTVEFKSYQEIQNILESKNISVINLNGTESYAEAYGKLLIDTDNNEAYLHITGLQNIEDDEKYNLWKRQGVSDSLIAEINLGKGFKYVSFNLQQIPNENDLIILTKGEDKIELLTGEY